MPKSYIEYLISQLASLLSVQSLFAILPLTLEFRQHTYWISCFPFHISPIISIYETYRSLLIFLADVPVPNLDFRARH